MDRRSLVQSLVSAVLGGIVGAVLVAAASSQPEPVTKDTGLQTQVATLLTRSTEQNGRISQLESAATGIDGRISYLENQDRLAVANAIAVNDAIQALTKQSGLLTDRLMFAPVGCLGEIAVWTAGLGLYC